MRRQGQYPLFRAIVIIHVVGLTMLFALHALFQYQTDISTRQGAAVQSSSLVDGGDPLRTSSPPKPILFLHFHKSGGSSVCHTMRASKDFVITDHRGLPDTQQKYNCNTYFSGPRLTGTRPDLQTCQGLIPYTTDKAGIPFRRNNFIAVEAPFQEEMPCPNFRSFAIMRHPIARLKSIMANHPYTEEEIEQWIQKRMTTEKTCLRGYPVVNSFVIRQLLGRRRFFDPRPIDELDFQRAKVLVDSFDAFVPLEHLNHTNVINLLRETVPEYYQSMQKHRLVKNANPRPKRPLSGGFLQQITIENKFDIMLYDYVIEKIGLS